MGSHTLDILRQGLWASLTGGWFYDPQQSTFCNTFHLYLWLFLLCLPLTIYLTVPGGFIAWAIYCGVVGILFIITKSINYALHHTFDHGEAILEDVSEEQEPTEDINQNEKQAPSHETAEQSGVNIEMVAMTSTRTEHTHTPPVLCSSRNSVQGESRRGSVRPMTPADSMEYINELIKGKDGKSSLGDLHVEIHQPDVKGSSPSKSQLHHIDAKGSSPSKAELLQPEIAVEHSLSRPDLNPANNAPVKKVSLKSLQITVLDDGEQGSSQPNLKNKDSSRSLPAQFSLAADQDKPSEPSCSHSEKLRDIRRTKSARTVSPKLKRVLFKQTSFHETSSHSDPTIAERTKADLLESLRAVNSGQSQSGVIGCNENNNNNREHNGCDATEDDTQKDKTVIGNSSKEDELSVVNPSLNLEQKDHGAEAIADSSGVSASVVVKGDFKQPSTNVVNNTGHDKAQSKSKRTKPNSSKGKRKRLKKKRQLNVPPSPTQPTAQPPHSSATQAWALNEFESDTDSLESGVCSNASVSTSSEENDLIEQLEVLAGEPSATANVATTVDEVDHEPGTSAEVIDKSKGAIPKRRPLPPIPQQGSRAQVDGDSPPLEVNTEELTARLLKILSKEDPSEAEEELRKLKEEMVQRKIQQQQRCEGQLESRVRLKTHRGLGLTPPSSASPSERSTLLPGTVGYSPAGGSGRRRAPRRRNSAGSRRSRHSSDRSSRPASGLVDDTLAPDKHVATSHNDTSEGAVHYFQDSRGKWFSYTFEPNSSGIANGVTPVASGKDAPWRDGRCDSSSDSDSTIVLEAPSSNRGGADVGLDNVFSFDLYNTLGSRPIRLNPLHSYMDQLLEVGRRRVGDGGDSDTDVSHNIAQLEPARPKQYYKFWYLPCLSMKVRVDRLAVLALLDRNVSLLENVLTVVLAVVVSMMGAAILSAGIFHDLWIFLYCLVIASCQYSLLKSVQPDATSPMHGYNRVVVFSRPFYFCLCCGLILLLGYARTVLTHTTVYIYGMAFTSQGALTFAQDMMIVFVLCFPLIFTIGLLPQVNTFITYVLEQLDIHMFGGTATTSLTSAVYSILKSMLAIALLYPVCFGPLWITKSVEVKVNSPAQEMPAQHVLFSVFTGLLVSLSYHLSRSSSDPTVLWDIIKRKMCRSRSKMNETSDNEELSDPLPGKLRKSVCQRLRSDLVVCFFIAIFTFAIHVSTVFTVLQPSLHDVLCYLAGIVGFICHYLLPHLRKEMPWLCCSHPLLASNERNLYEASDAAKIMWFERMYVWLRVFERNFIFPLVFLSGMTMSTAVLVEKFGVFSATLLIVLCSLRLLRGAFTDSPKQHLILILTYFFFKYDYSKASETFLVDYFIISILFTKLQEFMLKFQFILSYIAPWQIAWGSAFHAFAQPFSVPHSVMLFVQATVSAVFSAPLNPFLGSAIFITSYVRPIKFWERDYNTKRVDHTNTRLSSQLDRNPGADDNNLNSIFYEHLTRSLQHSLCGDLMLGRWGPVSQGDFFIMASDYLNALVHIVEVGNGLVTFQLRGLEFRGTYCQQREVEAITEGVEDDEGFCCCSPGHLPHFLSLNTAFNQRWLSWEVTVTKYILEGYSISDNSAATMLQVFELRKVLISYYVKSIIYYTVRSPHLESWLSNDTIQEALSPTVEKNYTDLDPTFSSNVDEDYDLRTSGITRSSFCRVYHQWIEYCANRRDESMESSPDSTLVSLCFSLSLLGRRVLGTASHNNASASVDFFLYGLHALFKGDFRITSSRDEWVFTDMEMLRKVVAPGVRMSLKLHQDHIANVEDFEDMSALYNAITSHEENMVISHEADPAWRNAVLHNVPSLLALRHVFDEGADEYKIIMLNKRYLSFRVIKVNRECVRGLWAGQQQELVFLRNRNPERGSIQNAKQALRNMINSSCDQPIGYPIYVSPLTTSYSSTSAQLSSVIGPEFSLKGVKNTLMNQWRRLRAHCGHNCTGSSADATVLEGACAMPSVPVAPPQSIEMSLLQFMGSRSNMTPPGGASTANKPAIMSLSSLSTVCETPLKESIMQRRVEIVDISYVYDSINLGRRIDVQWPSEEWRERGGKNGWNGWSPEKGQEGLVVHRWQPCHRDPGKRSHVDKTIVLVHIGEYYVPICEQGVNDLGAQV